MGNIIYWFRRDLRISDNVGFFNACNNGKSIIPVFILDDNILMDPDVGKRRVQFMYSCIKNLDKELEKIGGRLILMRGKALQELKKLVDQYDVESIYFNRDYTPYARIRDKEIWEYFRKEGIEIKSFKDTVLHEKREIVKGDGNPYIVFTYYYKKWINKIKDNILPEIKKIEIVEGVDSLEVAKLDSDDIELDYKDTYRDLVYKKVYRYIEDRDIPYKDGTSRLSPYLRFGVLSMRKIYNDMISLMGELEDHKKRENIQGFIRQLAWRDFYFQILYNFPYVDKESFLTKYRDLNWENDEELYNAWCEGRTGYPLVDAGMRQLLKEGWMHNRLRMIVASFLTKDLLIDWRWGERHFKRYLIDYDLPLNNGGWQWAASTGTDAQPYFRIFNPISQSKRYDPEGIYIKRYVDELRDIPIKYIHEPHKMPNKALDYPSPIVDHKRQRERALELYQI